MHARRTVAIACWALWSLGCGEDPAAPKVLHFTAGLALGETFLDWQVENADAVTITGPAGRVLVSGVNQPSGNQSIGVVAERAEWKLEATGPGGSAVAKVTVEPDSSILKVIRFAGEPGTIDRGSASTLSWQLVGPSPNPSVRITDAAGAEVTAVAGLTGSRLVMPTVDTVYTLTARLGSMTTTATTTVLVRRVLPTITSLTLNPNPIIAGQTVQISWATMNADEVQISKDGAVIRAWTTTGAAMSSSGTQITEASAVIKLEARNIAGTVAMERTITSVAPVVVSQFDVSPTRFSGTSTTVHIAWATMNATDIALTQDGVAVPNFPRTASGAIDVVLDHTATFDFVADNGATMVARRATVRRFKNLEVSVVLDDRAAPLEGASIRIENGDGTGFVEGTTGVDGSATVEVDPSWAPYSITAAKAGLTAVSIVGLAGAPTVPIRLDQAEVIGPHTVTGSISRKLSVNNPVFIDGYNFNTLTAQVGADYTSEYYDLGDVPFSLLAFELNPLGLIINITKTQTVARGADQELAITFPTVPVPPDQNLLIQFQLPSTGVFPSGALSAPNAQVFQLSRHRYGPSAPSGFIIFPGSSVGAVGSRVDLSFARWTSDPDLSSTYYYTQINDGFLQLFMASTDFSSGVRTVPAVSRFDSAADGSSARDFRAEADAPGWTHVLLHLGESEQSPPRWRVIFPLDAGGSIHGARVPSLPSTVSGAEIGLPPGPNESIALLAQLPAQFQPWALEARNTPNDEVTYQLGGTYIFLQVP